MCMKSVNINNTFFEENLSGINGNLRFGESKTKIKALLDSNSNYYINKLYILLNFSAMSSSEDRNLTNVYDIIWTFGCLNSQSDFENKTIAKTIIDTTCNKTTNSVISARSFTNQIRLVELKDYKIDELGQYYLKTYIKKHGTDDTWQVQSITSIEIEE